MADEFQIMISNGKCEPPVALRQGEDSGLTLCVACCVSGIARPSNCHALPLPGHGTDRGPHGLTDPDGWLGNPSLFARLLMLLPMA